MQNHEQRLHSGPETELVPDYIYGVRTWRSRSASQGGLAKATVDGRVYHVAVEAHNPVTLQHLYRAGIPFRGDISEVEVELPPKTRILVGAFHNVWVKGLNTAVCVREGRRENAYYRISIGEAHAQDLDRLLSNSGGYFNVSLNTVGPSGHLETLIRRGHIDLGAQVNLDLTSSEWSVVDYEISMPPLELRYNVNYAMIEPLRQAVLTVVIERPVNTCGGVSPDCTCGFYAYTEPGAVFSKTYFNDTDRVIGIVRGSGMTTVGSKGFRTQKAEILALAVLKYFGRDADEARLLESAYGVPVKHDVAGLQAWARTYLPNQEQLHVALGIEKRITEPLKPPPTPPMYNW